MGRVGFFNRLCILVLGATLTGCGIVTSENSQPKFTPTLTTSNVHVAGLDLGRNREKTSEDTGLITAIRQGFDDSLGTNANLADKLRQQGIQAYQQGDQIHIIMSNHMLFRPGTTILIPSSYPKLNNVVPLLQRYKPSPIIITAYSDNTGSKAYLQELTHFQAERVKSYLWAQGIPAERMETKGGADTNPIASNATPQGKAFNDRVEIRTTQPIHNAGILPFGFY